tara:strand:+ start:1666 stop:1842 length:177 start_codon:yes stop_codon:yes gene_type:complete
MDYDDEPIEAREAWQAELRKQSIRYWVTLQASEPGELQRWEAEAKDHNPWPCNDWRHG